MAGPDQTRSTDEGPLISVIMNGFNSARYLYEALASVLAQTYPRWELVFWDNCSSDDSEAIVRSHGDPRIHFYRAPQPCTLARGRNAAIAHSQGEWLAFLDCDDVWEPDKLAHQLTRLRQDPRSDEVGLIYARTVSFSARGSEGETAYRYTGKPLPEGEIAPALLREGNFVHIVSALVSRRAYVAVEGIPEHLTFAEDYWLFVAVAERFRTVCVQTTCCHYRVHEQSATFRNKLASHREALEVLEHWRQLLSPAEFAQRRRVYHTLIAIERLRQPGARAAALVQLLRRGSVAFLIAGTARNLYRRHIRRQRPYA